MGGMADRLQGGLQNPMMMGGLGLLSGNQSGNPWGGLLGGLEFSQQAKAQAEERQRQQAFQKRLADLTSVRTPGFVPPELRAGSNWMEPPQVIEQQPQMDMATIMQLMLQSPNPNERLQATKYFAAQDANVQQMNLENARADRALEDQKELAQYRAQLTQDYPRQQTMPSNLVEWNAFQEMAPEDQKQYLLMKRGDPGLSSRSEDALYTTTDDAVGARANVQKYNNLAQRMVQVDPTAGFVGSMVETFKGVTGTEDAATLVRKDWVNLRNSAAIQNLPPGVASDKDIELVLAGFLPENARPETIAQFMRGLAKAEEVKADYLEFKANYIAADPQRGPIGLSQAWRDYSERLQYPWMREQDTTVQPGGVNDPGLQKLPPPGLTGEALVQWYMENM